MSNPDDSKRLVREVEALLKLQPNPQPASEWTKRKKYSGPNPYEGPDPKGDAEIELHGGLVSTAETRAVTRAKLAEAWEQGKREFLARHPAA